MKRLFWLSISAVLALSLSGCSIFSFKIRGGKLVSNNLVEVSRPQFAATNSRVEGDISALFAEVVKSANALVARSSTDYQQRRAKDWLTKAAAAQESINAQQYALMQILDTWVYINQVTHYLTKGAGRSLFGRDQYLALGTLNSLQAKIDSLAKRALGQAQYQELRSFVHTRHIPYATPFSYKSVAPYWQRKRYHEPEAEFSPAETPQRVAASSHNIMPKPLVKAPPVSSYQQHELDEQPDYLASAYQDSPLATTEEYLPADSFDNTLALSSGLPTNIISNTVKPLAIEMTGSLSSLAEQEQQLFEQMQASSLHTAAVTEALAKNGFEKFIDKYWHSLDVSVPTMLLYLAIFVIMLFFMPFFLGYVIGKKRQDPNFTVIKAERSRTAINKPADVMDI